MPITEPNNPTGIRAYIDAQIDAVQALFGGGVEVPTVLSPDEKIIYTRAAMTVEEADNAEDMFGFEYDGNRTGYNNEYGEVRGIAAKTSTVAARFKKRAGGTANILEVCDISNNLLAGFDKDGKLVGPGVEPGSWNALTYQTGAATGAGYPTAGVRLEPVARVVRLRGRIDISGAGFSSGVTCATVPAGFRPASIYSSITRTNSAGALITINTDGTIQVGTALTAGGFVSLDGITWPLA